MPLLIHSPRPPSDAIAKELRALGEVAWLVVPNRFHHLGTPSASAAFPDAKIVGPKNAAPKNAALRLDLSIDDPALDGEGARGVASGRREQRARV